MRLLNVLLILALSTLVACSGAPEKKDKLDSEGGSDEIASDGDLVKEVEEMPSADSLDDGGEEQVESGDVSAAVAGDINQAVLAAEKGDLEGAANDLIDLVEQPDGGFLAAYNLGVIRERQGRYEASAKRYFQALKRNPDFSPALLNLIRLYLRNNRANDGQRLAEQFIAKRPDNLGHRVAKLEVSLAKGAYEDVISESKQVLRKDERQVDAMFALAQANFQLGRYELARAVIVRAVELKPNRPDLYNLYGLIEMNLDNDQSAIANFKKAIELQPQYPEARNNLGVLYQKARDYNGAAEEIKEAIRAYPDFEEAFVNLGNAYKGMGRYKDAELAFKRAIELDDAFANAHFNLGILYLDSEVPGMDTIGRLQKAIDSFQTYKSKAKKLAKNDPVEKYIGEARKGIEVEKQRQEMEREAQMGAETSE